MTEFEFIRNIKKKYGLDRVGDDCAVLPKDSKTDLVVTADLLVEDIDFRLDWTTPEFLGQKALTVSLSDIAAMGGTPRWAMLSIAVPETLWRGDFLDRFYEGWHRNARKWGVELVGGDVSRTPDKFVVDSIVGGDVPAGGAVLRRGAKVGDAIVVTDRVGGSAGGLKLLESGRRAGEQNESWEEALLSVHLQPSPQTGTGVFLRERKLANSMIDISDGLASDLKHICNASNVGARVTAESIPLDPNLRNLIEDFEKRFTFAISGGEDFQLLFTLPRENVSELSAGPIDGSDHGVFTVIGEVTSNAGVIEIVRNGKTEILEAKGYRHF